MAARPKFPAMSAPKGALLHNDDSHNFPDPNSGGGPLSEGSNPPAHTRGGFGAKGQRGHGSGLGGSARPNAPNPASKGGGASIGAMQPEARISGHGGSPQHGERHHGDYHFRGGLMAHGQEHVPGGHKTEVPSHIHAQSNPSGRSYKLIAGRFKRAAMGAKASGSESRGAYGGAPVTANT
jgi:hypothetical protein